MNVPALWSSHIKFLSVLSANVVCFLWALYAFMHTLLSAGILFCPWPPCILFSINKNSSHLLFRSQLKYLFLWKSREVPCRPKWVTPAFMGEYCLYHGTSHTSSYCSRFFFTESSMLNHGGILSVLFPSPLQTQHPAQYLQHGTLLILISEMNE